MLAACVHDPSSATALSDGVVPLVQDKVHARRGHHHATSPAHTAHVRVCAHEASLCVQVGQRTLPLPQSMSSLSLPPKVWQWLGEPERGDDEDHAGRCRSDARAQPSTAFVAERVGGTVARAGVDFARERENSFRYVRCCTYPTRQPPPRLFLGK